MVLICPMLMMFICDLKNTTEKGFSAVILVFLPLALVSTLWKVIGNVVNTLSLTKLPLY